MRKPKKIKTVKNINSLLNKFILFNNETNQYDKAILVYVYKIDKKKKMIYYCFKNMYGILKHQERWTGTFIEYIEEEYKTTYSI